MSCDHVRAGRVYCARCGADLDDNAALMAEVRELREKLAATQLAYAQCATTRDEYRTEWQSAVDRLGADDHIRREMQARERNMVADLAEAQKDWGDLFEQFGEVCKERDEAREALRKIQAWDMLNPPNTEQIADARWLRELVDAALAKLDK